MRVKDLLKKVEAAIHENNVLWYLGTDSCTDIRVQRGLNIENVQEAGCRRILGGPPFGE